MSYIPACQAVEVPWVAQGECKEVPEVATAACADTESCWRCERLRLEPKQPRDGWGWLWAVLGVLCLWLSWLVVLWLANRQQLPEVPA